MRARRWLSIHAVVLLLVAVNGISSPRIARAATGQASPQATAIEKAIVLSSPAVVFIDTSVVLKVGLTYRSSSTISGLGRISDTYRFDYATGSGFAVTPNGTVVTASHVVEPPHQEMMNYAANRMVLEGFGYSYPSKNSSPFDQYTLPLGYLNTLLQQSYRGVAMKVQTIPQITVYTAVDVAQQQLPQGEPASVLLSTGFDKTDVAILKVNATNMPTVGLAATASTLASGAEVTAVGFPGSSRDALQTGVTEPTKVFGHISTIRHEATGDLIEIDAATQPGMSGGPVIDAQGDVIGLTSFTLLQASGEAGAKYLRTVDDIKSALAQAGVTPQRSGVDTSFAAAMDLFWSQHYAASIPQYQRTIALWDGHPLAKEYLARAEQLRGTAQDIPVTPRKASSSFPLVPVAAGVVVLLFVVGALLMRSRRSVPAQSAAGPASIPAPGGAAAASTVSVTAPAPPAPVSGSQTAPAPMPSPTPRPVSVGAPADGTSSPNGRSQPEADAAPVSAEHHFCGSCGERVEPDEHFCLKCGHPLR